MNIKDVEVDSKIAENSEDMLTAIFNGQRKLMEKYHHIEKSVGLLQTEDVPVNLHSHKGQARLKDFAWRITEEIGEAMSCLKNKPWKQTQMETDVIHYYEELSDALHFFIELCILSGIDEKMLYDLYFRKHSVNLFRQRSQY